MRKLLSVGLVMAWGVVALQPLCAEAQVRRMPYRSAITVDRKVDLLRAVRSGRVEYHVNPKNRIAPSAEAIFCLKGRRLMISGEGMGYMSTVESYKNYRLVVEYRWRGEGIAPRADKARDNGILIHARGVHGALDGTWPACVESNIIEGGMGDFIVLSDRHAPDSLGESSLCATMRRDRDGELCWDMEGERQTVHSGRVNWQQRDPDWADVRGYRGANDPDHVAGRWNRMEIVAEGASLRVYVNGRLVNQALEVRPAEGHICIQTEFAGMEVRRWVLLPLNNSNRVEQRRDPQH